MLIKSSVRVDKLLLICGQNFLQLAMTGPGQKKHQAFRYKDMDNHFNHKGNWTWPTVFKLQLQTTVHTSTTAKVIMCIVENCNLKHTDLK